MSQEWRLQAAPREPWPCELAPDLWFSTVRRERGLAIHGCRRHCPRIRECWETETRPHDGVLAGILFTPQGVRSKKQPPAVRCAACAPAAVVVPESPRKDPTDTGRCGEMAGYHRHVYRHERACAPCRAANAAKHRERRAAA